MKKYFTITELLIVIAVLVVLLSLIQPSLKNAIENANLLNCGNKMKTIFTGFLLFSEDMDGSLPGGTRDNWNPDLLKRSWIGNETGFRDNDPSKKIRGTKHIGSIWPYLGEGNSGDFYRCPSVELGTWNSGEGSNGLFDYVGFNAFSGAKVSLVSQKAYFGNASSDDNYIPPIDQMEEVYVPIISEEDSYYWLNRVHIEAGHGGGDRLAKRHLEGANYATLDGSVHRMEFNYRGPKAFEWRIKSPKGNYVNLSNGSWGTWNQR